MSKATTALIAIFLWLAAPVWAANPYAPTRTVNGAVITQYDIVQRANLLDALGADGDLRTLALDQLTDDRLKVQSASQIGFELPEDAVLGGIEEFAAARGMTIDDVLQILETRKIDRQTMDDFVEAGLIWREVVTARFRSRALPTDAEVEAAIAIADRTPIEVYHLAEISLPYAERGQPATLQLAEEITQDLAFGASFEDAARQFSRSASAANGGAIPPMPLEGMPPPLRATVQNLRPGQVSRPVEITGGVAILKLISIGKELPKRDPEMTDFDRKEAMRRKIFSERITAFGEGYLQELKTDALIVDQ
ncbi:MAG: peptidylprolyl isomerase [Rhodobacteraceae bacterium]|uniref:peptidylprolyl isomerase n=1 Tax=Amaricoccus sp. B4 TaxID=3368557 RepID=UPI000DAD1FA6|nr:peptidylprolyl isomerase [Paracoccaceae bacterium]